MTTNTTTHSPFALSPLPYDYDALEPHISRETLEYHHDKHHAAYINNLNRLIDNTPFADMSLEEIIQQADGAIFNNAAQAWNHNLYWPCLSPNGGGEPTDDLLNAINDAFGSTSALIESFNQKALGQFGSGWAWLVKDKQNQLSIVTTNNAGNPLRDHLTPIIACDVWEHAYYIDTRNNRGAYLNHFWSLIDWNFIAEQWKNA